MKPEFSQEIFQNIIKFKKKKSVQ